MSALRIVNPRSASGFTLVELMISLVMGVLILAALASLSTQSLQTEAVVQEHNELAADARFAMQRMVTAVLGTRHLLLPLADNPNTNWRENLREQTVPASAPEGSSTLATAVLAVTLDPTLDVDGDGFADSDSDKDGKTDEDPDDDNSVDGKPGIIGIDDDGDGSVDEGSGPDAAKDDDEDGSIDEDIIDGVDNDGDGSVDEDAPKDINDDGRPGISGIDDDGDGTVDEGFKPDDDEDGASDEDWFDPVVFFLDDTTLLERRPNLNPVDGNDYNEYPIAENVTRFRVERIPQGGSRAVLVDLTLDTTGPDGKTITLNTRVRVGGGQ